MTQLVEFHIQPSGRIEVMLGIHMVGVIEPWCERSSYFGKIGAHYSVTLPECGRTMPRPATSVQVARRLILHRLAQWFDAAGPLWAPMAEALAIQAESERSAR
jgi:hypothetical protein